MEWSPTRVTYVIVTSLICVLQLFARPSDSKKIANYSIPGAQCGEGYIIDTGDQYEVHTAFVKVNGTVMPQYTSDIDCALRFRAHANQRILIRIIKFSLEDSRLCQKDALYLLDGVEENAKLMTKSGYPLCGNTLSLPNYFSTSGNGVTIRFVSDTARESDGFRMYVTPFTTGIECGSGKFECLEHKKCITGDALCNGANQCEDGSDEPDECPSGATRNVKAPYGSLVFILTILTMYCLR